MNRRDLAKAVAVHSDVHLSTVQKVLDGFTDVVTAVVSKGEPVLITGFAKFAKVERSARVGRNPATGEQIQIKASKRVRISPSKALKDAILSPATSPRLVRGAWPLDVEAVKRAGQSAGATHPKKAAASLKTPAKKVAAKNARAPKKAVGKKAAVAVARKTTSKKARVRPAAR